MSLMPSPWSGELGPEGEEQWRRLARHVQLVSGFWLGFVFTPSPLSALVLRLRLEQELALRGRTLLEISISRPDELTALLDPLPRREDIARAGCTWIVGLHADTPGPSEGDAPELRPWTLAWDTLFLRLNERRDRLRGRLQGGLVFVAPPGIKPRVREAAPDLWSVRELVIELRPTPPTESMEPGVLSQLRRVHESRPGPGGPDPMLALARAVLPETDDPVERGEMLLRAAEGFLAEGKLDEVLEPANEAAEILHNLAPGLESRALALRAEVRESLGEIDTALRDILRALDLRRRSAAELPQEWVHRAARLHLKRGRPEDPPRALRLYQGAVSALGGAEHEASRRQLILARVGLSEALSATGQRDQALAELCATLSMAYEEARREGSPAALQALGLTYHALGDVHLDTGDVVSAIACYHGALEAHRRRSATLGDPPDAVRADALRDESVSLNRLGLARWLAGDLRGAREAFLEALALRERIVEIIGPTPQASADLTSSHIKITEIDSALEEAPSTPIPPRPPAAIAVTE